MNSLLKKDIDYRLFFFCLIGVGLQALMGLCQPGFYYPDEHFQIIAFSDAKRGDLGAVSHIWEYAAQIRPSLQVYFFSAFRNVCEWMGMGDAFSQMALLKVLMGCGLLVIFDFLALFYFAAQPQYVIYSVIGLLQFSWLLPYTRTLFGSEMFSSALFFGAILLFERTRGAKRAGVYWSVVGFLFALAFFARFQMAAALFGAGVFFLFEKLPIRFWVCTVLGFLVGFGINLLLDNSFYGHFVFTPYRYFFSNVVEGKADSFGTSSFLRYVFTLAAVLVPPFCSIGLLVGIVAFFTKRWHNLVFLSVLGFVVAHCFVGHKEERFMFPIMNAMPLLCGWALPWLLDCFNHWGRVVQKVTTGLLVFSGILNVVLFFAFFTIPYCQTVYFDILLKTFFDGKAGEVVCINRNPLETESHLPLSFYAKSMGNIQFKKLSGDSIIVSALENMESRPLFLATTYNDGKTMLKKIEGIGYRPVLFSSGCLWGINSWLDDKGGNTINDIWVLYVFFSD